MICIVTSSTWRFTHFCVPWVLLIAQHVINGLTIGKTAQNAVHRLHLVNHPISVAAVIFFTGNE
jgi:hypothetical protein